jgi:hypothetical protein
MYAKFNINISEVRKLRRFSMFDDGCHVNSINPDEVRKKIRPFLKSLVSGNTSEGDVLDGEALKNFVFPTGEVGTYDVFISYSHTDMDDAILLASWLEQLCGLKVFLDYYVWGSADGLLLDIDNHYCKQKNGLYNYRRRNYSTSHVHAMLSMAIMDVINNTECCIFFNSGHSICLTNLQKSTSVKTLSPWIYEENKMMILLPSRLVRREVKYFSAIEKAEIFAPLNEMMIEHNVDLEGFKTLTFKDLMNLKGKGIHGLDELYGSLAGVRVLNG